MEFYLRDHFERKFSGGVSVLNEMYRIYGEWFLTRNEDSRS